MARNRHVPTILPWQTLNLCVSEIAETHAAAFAFCVVFDRSCLDPHDFADEWSKTRQMSACLARKNLGQSVALTLVRSFIDVKGNFPFRLQHVTWRIGRERRIEAV